MDKQIFLVTDIKISYQLRTAKTYYVQVDENILLGPYAAHKMWMLADPADAHVKAQRAKMTAADWEAVFNSPLGPNGSASYGEMSGSG